MVRDTPYWDREIMEYPQQWIPLLVLGVVRHIMGVCLENKISKLHHFNLLILNYLN